MKRCFHQYFVTIKIRNALSSCIIFKIEQKFYFCYCFKSIIVLFRVCKLYHTFDRREYFVKIDIEICNNIVE